MNYGYLTISGIRKMLPEKNQGGDRFLNRFKVDIAFDCMKSAVYLIFFVSAGTGNGHLILDDSPSFYVKKHFEAPKPEASPVQSCRRIRFVRLE